jgi:pilus assembly protein CpaF
MSLFKRLEQEKRVAVGEEYGDRRQRGRDNLDPYGKLKVKLHQKLIEQLDEELMGQINRGEGESKQLQVEIERVLGEILLEDSQVLPRVDRQKIVGDTLNEIIGYGPINPLVQDPTISEIMVNGPYQVYVEREGKVELTRINFRDDSHVMHIIDKIISPLGRRVDESSPMVDARLPDGSRVNAIIPPLALNGPTLTIRKFSREPFMVEDLIRFGTLTQDMARFIRACVQARLNILVSGGTSSGKTTTLNVLSSFIPSDERIVTIEDAAELQLRQEHVVSLETRPANIEGKGAIVVRDLVRNALRMRPDRIVVGEVRSGETLDMLQAMNTGHDGSMTTLHANSPRDVLSRMETMVLMAGVELPVRAIREQISSAIDLIVHQSRMRDGTRKITYLTEVQGMEGDVITLQDIFLYDQQGKDNEGRLVGRFRATGLMPKFLSKLEAAGIYLPSNIFGG